MVPRQTLEREILRLQDELLTLGNRVSYTIVEAVDLLKRRDLVGAQRLIAEDRLVNERRLVIEADCLTLIATQQPIAGDLRIIAAMLDIATELERINDYAKGIAKVTLMLGERELLKPPPDLPHMAQLAQGMLHRALHAFARRDVGLARSIPAGDDAVDALYNQVYRELMTLMIANPATLDCANCLLWVAHNLERTADRVINICERVVFTVTGEMVELDAELESPPIYRNGQQG